MESMRGVRILLGNLSLAILFLAAITPSVRATEPATPNITLTGTLSSKSITQDEFLRFAITVENKTTETLTALRLSGPPDGYKWQDIHAQNSKGADAYYKSAQDFKEAKNILFPSVPPGATYTAWGYLKPVVSHKAASLIVLAEWTLNSQKAGTPASSATVVLGENAVQDDGDRLWGYVVVLALPVALAALPFVLGSISKRRDERSETLRQMLSKSLEHAASYYLPLSAAAERLVQALQPPATAGPLPNPPNALLSFYYVIYMEKRMTEQRRVVGGFYFKDQRAEILASMCWKEYSDALLGIDRTDDFNRSMQACVNKLRDRENFDAFAKKLEMNTPGVFSYPDAQCAWQLFKVKLTQVSIASVVLDLKTLQALIDYEVNRPFENWYPNALPQFLVEKDVKERLQFLAKKLQFTADQKEYVDQIEVFPANQ